MNQVAINNWISHSHIDYLAGAGSYKALVRGLARPVPTLVRSKPGEAKSSFVEGPLLDHLEAKLFPGEAVEIEDLPDVLSGNHVHFSANRTVACLTDLAAMRDPVDYKGFMVPKKDGTSGYTIADLITKERMLYELGVKLVVLFLDEIMQSDHLTQKALTDVLLNGRFGDYSLRSTTWVIAASNRMQDGAGVNRTLTILQNRINTLEIFLPVDVWADYASAKLKLPPLCVTFAKAQPGDISIDVPPRDGAFPSWRSYTYASQWLKQYKEVTGTEGDMHLPLDNDYARSKVMGFVGEGLMVKLASYAKVIEFLPTIEEIKRDPMSAKLPPTQRMDAAYATAQMLVHYADADNMDTLWKYAMRLPKELQVATAKDMLKVQGSGLLHNSKELGGWIKQNGSLIMASA